MHSYLYRDQTAITIWLGMCLLLVFGMVALGGYTRLSGSGLSITEWAPIHGVVPPMGEAQWQEEFEAYQQIPQYQLVNKGMSLEEFKIIFWPEFFHRLLGRAIGFVFLFPLLIFSLRKSLHRRFGLRLAGIFLLGGMQGLVGWLMVKSGLQDNMIAVSPIKLALHLSLALLIFCLLLWALLDVIAPCLRSRSSFAGKGFWTGWFGLLWLQIIFGALVAGSHAGLVYNSWPLMNGDWIAPDVGHNFASTVQFIHRKLAILLVIFYFYGWFFCRVRDSVMHAMGGILALQFALGIWTLLDGGQGEIPLILALSHQMVAFVLAGLTVTLLHRLRKQRVM